MISNVLLRLDNAYPSADDRAAIDHYLATADARRAALDEVRRVAGDVTERTVAAIKARYPQMARFHTSGYEKAKRDVGMLTNMAANAMFLGEHESLDDMFTHWFRTILKGVHMSPQLMRESYQFWLDQLQAHLSPAAYALLRPHAEHLADALCDLPVTARDETGVRRTVGANGTGG